MGNKDIDREKEEISKQEEKEEKALNKILPITVMIGIVVGMILTFTLDNIMYLGVGTIAGLLLGLLFASIKAEDGIEFSKKGKK